MPPWTDWVWPVLLSPFIGSFLGVVVARAEEPFSILTGRSRCDTCGMQLHPLDLAPLVSWLRLLGRCRYCGHGIGLFHPAMELSAIAVALWAAYSTSGPLLWLSCGLGWTLLALAAIDFRLFLLPDFLTLPLILAGLLAGFIVDTESVPMRAAGALLGWALVIGIRFVYQRLRDREGMGLGDAKLLAAAGAWVSLEGIPSVLLIGALSGLAFALIDGTIQGRLTLTDRIPFGAFLSLGTFMVWLYGPVVIG